MQIQEIRPDMTAVLGESRADKLFRNPPGRLCDLLEVRAERDPLLVRLGQAEVMFRVSRQCGLGGSKKSATLPSAALTCSRIYGNSANRLSAA